MLSTVPTLKGLTLDNPGCNPGGRAVVGCGTSYRYRPLLLPPCLCGYTCLSMLSPCPGLHPGLSVVNPEGVVSLCKFLQLLYEHVEILGVGGHESLFFPVQHREAERVSVQGNAVNEG